MTSFRGFVLSVIAALGFLGVSAASPALAQNTYTQQQLDEAQFQVDALAGELSYAQQMYDDALYLVGRENTDNEGELYWIWEHEKQSCWAIYGTGTQTSYNCIAEATERYEIDRNYWGDERNWWKARRDTLAWELESANDILAEISNHCCVP